MHPSISFVQQYWRKCQAGTPAEVILGSPKTRNCKNFGICRVSLEQSQKSGFCDNQTVAYLRVDQPTGRLLIHFLSCSFNTSCVDRFFQTGNFRMDEDYFIPQKIAQALSIDSDNQLLRIEKGDYPILIDEHFHTVSLRLSKATLADTSMLLAA